MYRRSSRTAPASPWTKKCPVPSGSRAVALVLTLADLLGRTAAAPPELPVGIVTAVVGGPYLLWLLLTTRTRRLP